MSSSLIDQLILSRELGFLGPAPAEDHLRHASAFAEGITTAPARALDMGAGGGLPGLVLAATVWPDTHWCFVDARAKRTAFLEEAVLALGLADRVKVVTGRAEEIGRDPEHRQVYDLVVARSFASPAVTAECAAPFLRASGALLVSEPPAVDAAVRWPADGVAKFGFAPPVSIVAEGPNPVHLARLEMTQLTHDRFPRRVGIPAKRPLF